MFLSKTSTQVFDALVRAIVMIFVTDETFNSAAFTNRYCKFLYHPDTLPMELQLITCMML